MAYNRYTNIGVIILVTFIFKGPLLSAQFPLLKGTYNYSFNGDLVLGSTEITFNGTTLDVNGDSLQIFSRNSQVKFFDSPDIETRSLPNLIIASPIPNLVTYQCEGFDSIQVLYNFNLQVGDRYVIYPDLTARPGSDSIIVEVISYGDSLISGQETQYQQVEYSFDRSPYTIRDFLFKNIGSLSFYMNIFDIFSNQLGGGEGGPLVCYESDSFTYLNNTLSSSYLNEISSSCLTVSGVEQYANDTPKVYPNPASDYINLELNDFCLDYKVEIISLNSMTFKVLEAEHSQQVGNNIHRFDISKLPKGIYLLRHKQGYQKFVKQ